MIRLLHPHVGWWKCNTNGASTRHPRQSATSFSIRSSVGDLVGSKGRKIQHSTSILDEFIVTREGLQYCCDHGSVQVLLESDANALVHMFNV